MTEKDILMNRKQLPGMKRYFITAVGALPLLSLLQENLHPRYDAGVIIESGGVWSGKQRLLNPRTLIRPGDTVKVHISSCQGKKYEFTPQDIIHENADLLVVYKPPDLSVHGVPSSYCFNLAYGVNEYLRQKGISYPSTPVTRLDRPVGGLVIFPKTKRSAAHLSVAITHRRIKKWYMAVLEGTDGPRLLRVRDTISTVANRTGPDPGGKDADTLFCKTENVGHMTLGNAQVYNVFIFTGRRHQIRFHASHYLSPIVGDWFYGAGAPRDTNEIALLCRGYNIPYHGRTLKIRLPQSRINEFLRGAFQKNGLENNPEMN